MFKNKHIKKSLQWLLHHAITVFSCVAIIALGIVVLAHSSPGITTIGENITTTNLTASGNLEVGGNATTTGNFVVSGNTTLATTTLSGNLDLSLKELKNAVLEKLSDFPLNPTEGQMFWSTASSTPYWYDETNARWKGDVSGATYVVSASNSKNKEKADYVCDGTDDQVEIQAAIDSLPSSGGSLRLTEGLYIKNSAVGIAVPSNVGIYLDVGATIKLADGINDDACIFKNEDQTNENSNIVIQGGILDGNRANQSSGEQNIIEFIKVSSSKVDSLMKDARSHYVKMTGCRGVEIINRQYPLSEEIGEFMSEQEINPPNILFDELESGWSLVQNAVYDTTKFFSGTGSIKFTASDGWNDVGLAEKTFSPARDFSRAVFWMAVNFGDTDYEDHWYHHIELYAPNINNKIRYSLSPMKNFHLKNTWLVAPVVNRTVYGDPDLTNVTKIILRAHAASGRTATTWVDKMFLTYSSLGKGMVTFSWDDGRNDVFEVFAPIFDKYGYRAVAAINPSFIGVYGGYMSLSELKTLQNKGWDISNHGWAHVGLRGATEAVAEDDVRRGQDWLIQNGFRKGARFYVYPAAWTDEIGYEVVRKYHLMARTVQDPGQMNPFPLFRRELIFTAGMGGKTLDYLKTLVDDAFQRGLWLNLYGHTTEDITAADLDNLLSYINNKGLIIFITLLLATVYLLVSEPVYEATGQLLIESQRSSLLEESIGFPGANSPLIFNTAIERIKGRSITDSVIVKTNSFVVMEKEALDFIDYLASSPPDSIKIFNIVLSRNSNDNNDSDYRVFDSNGNLLASGFFGKKLTLENVTLVLNSLMPSKGFEIEILPIRSAREIISNNLKVSNIRNTNIIQFSYRNVSPLRAKQVIDGYITEFSNLNLLEKREEVTTRKNFLEDQFERISAQLKDAENDYKEFKLAQGFFALDEQTKQYIERIGALEEKRVDYEIRITEASATKKQSEKVLSGDPELQEYIKLTSSPFFQENTILQGLYSTIAELQVKNAKLRAEYSPSHPIVLQNESELEAAKKQLEEATSVTIANATKGVDPLLRPVVENLVINHININVYDRVLNQIKSEIEKFDTIMKSLPEAEVEQAQLERRMRINEQTYNLLLSRLQEARIMEASTISDVRVVNTAELPQRPVAPDKKKVLLMALLAGLFVSGSVVFAFEQFKTSFSTIESIERECGTPVVSLLPRLTKGRKKKREIIIGFEKKEDHYKLHAFELFNTLRMNLLFSDSFQKSKTLVVTSSIPQEGKSFVSANLAVTMAHAGMKVLLLDCDFRHPSQHHFFNVPQSPGLIDFINNGSLDEVVKTNYSNLFLLPVGSLDENVVITELINNSNLISSIEKLQESFDLIIIDTPPVNLFTDAVVLSSHFKNILMVMRYDTNKDFVLYSKKILSNVGATIPGIVVNDVKKSRLFGAQYGYGYGYGYGYDKQK